MEIRIEVKDYTFEASEYSVSEAATPLAAGDSSGSVGEIKFSLPVPDEDLVGTQDTGWAMLKKYGADYLIDAPVRLSDARKGFTVGTVNGVTRNFDSGMLDVTCVSRLGSLQVYGIQAQPYVGTLGGAFQYYLSLAGITTSFLIDDAITDRYVVFPGWSGELWYYLKQMAQAQDCDVSLVSGVVVLRPIRMRLATSGRDISRNRDLIANTLAQAVEVYKYENTPISNELVYPPGGWTPEVDVLNVNAGEEAEYTLELSSSVSSIVQPTMVTFVDALEDADSVYTIVANDGLPIQPRQWRAFGGKVEIKIDEDTTHLNIKLTGASGLPTSSGTVATNFSLALASDDTGNRYSTLRILGTGVGFTKEKIRVRTGVPASKSATDIGVTIDNPFISTTNDLYRAGTRAAKNYSGQVPALSGAVLAINRLGDTGSLSYPSYDYVEQSLKLQMGTPTYAQVETYYKVTRGLPTYGAIQDYWFAVVKDDFANQVLGNVNGARIFDKGSRRWYRIRTGTSSPDRITFTAEDDLSWADIEEYHLNRSYSQVQAILQGSTHKQAQLLGLYDGTN